MSTVSNTPDSGTRRAADICPGGMESEASINTTGRVVGYVRVSTGHQDHDAQRLSMERAGVAEVAEETASGAAGAARPVRDALLAELAEGDVLVVWRLDRLGRSMAEVVALVDDLRARGVHLRSLTEAIDTATVPGRMVVAIIASLAEMEREAIAARTRAGLAAARRRGRVGGRPTVLTPERLAAVAAMRDAGATLAETSAALGISRASVARARRRLRDEAAA